MRNFVLLLGLVLTGSLAQAQTVADMGAPVPLPQGASSVHFDESTRRLYVTADDAIDIFDEAMQQTASVPVARAEMVVLSLPLRRGYALEAAEGTVAVFDPATQSIITHQKLDLESPMTMAFEPRTTSLAVFGKQKAVLLDAAGDKSAIALDLGGVTSAVADGSGKLFAVNGANEVAAIEAKTGRIAHWSLPPSCGGAVALALDDQDRHLFVACRQAKLVSLDSDYGRAETMLDLSAPAEALAYNPPADSEGEGRLFALGGGAVSSIGSMAGGGKDLKIFVSTPVSPQAAGLALDQQGHRLFTLVPGEAPGSAALQIFNTNGQ